MPAFQPTADQFRGFRDDAYEGPIAQVNLLKLRPVADYGDDPPADHEPGETGAIAYQRYAEAFGVAAAEVCGHALVLGTVERYFIGQGDWDAVMVMHFPNRAAFIPTINHSTYAEMHRHRDAGLLCQDLLTVRQDA